MKVIIGLFFWCFIWIKTEVKIEKTKMKNKNNLENIELELMDQPSKAELRDQADNADWQANVMFIVNIILLGALLITNSGAWERWMKLLVL